MTPVRPAYGQGSLAEVFPSILATWSVPGAVDLLGLTGQLAGARKVAVLLVDGLGRELLPVAAPVAPVFADALAGRPLAGRGSQLGSLTATFPSTTPTSLTSLGTGAAPGGHGLLGFTVNVPGTGRVLNHIDWYDDPDPLVWQPLTTQFARAAAAGVAVRVVAAGAYVGSGLTRSAWRGGAYRPADDWLSVAEGMLGGLREASSPALVYGYHPDLDAQGHRFGVDSPQWRAAAVEVDQLLTRVLDGLPADAALVVIADHGQLDVPAAQRFDVAAKPALRAGVRVLAGEPRVRYLHTEPGAVADVVAAWQAVLGEAAWVATREEAIADGWFGPVVTSAHTPRIGDVVVVCRDRYAVFATDREPPELARLVAFHGSWTAAEMLVPLLVVPARD
ncbi:alkaline phosphatase family protein [Natronosporangium hydrolyticum]|uniref:Alkaline phosphatase family protein n=1 Tax=Natronosporangium hydrolyticum TaxID=2811111 RepID=A0A895YJV0_9ACTN|nr:nucleotide pyrophosphatase/phosphodiesterase family protein [Natronosporangium hydrolyticum]QSB16285.1 alkaline phosphatase family protein [Natronosporangium hydrolyticum]